MKKLWIMMVVLGAKYAAANDISLSSHCPKCTFIKIPPYHVGSSST